MADERQTLVFFFFNLAAEFTIELSSLALPFLSL